MGRYQQFHYERAKAEVEAAQRATTQEAVRLHCELADLHFARLSDGDGDDPDDEGFVGI